MTAVLQVPAATLDLATCRRTNRRQKLSYDDPPPESGQFTAPVRPTPPKPRNPSNSMVSNRLKRRAADGKRVRVPDYTYRYYDPQTGRWASREPLGEQASVNLMAYIWNDPITGWDVLGSFGDGSASGFKGHAQFETPNGVPSIRDPYFDYTAEDHGKNRPMPENPTQALQGEWNPTTHFQDIETSTNQVIAAINNCDNVAYSAAMHRFQDYFTHYSKGYRWNLEDDQLGHIWDGTTPDKDNSAWDRANNYTKTFNQRWNEHCCKCGNKYNVRSSGPCN